MPIASATASSPRHGCRKLGSCVAACGDTRALQRHAATPSVTRQCEHSGSRTTGKYYTGTVPVFGISPTCSVEQGPGSSSSGVGSNSGSSARRQPPCGVSDFRRSVLGDTASYRACASGPCACPSRDGCPRHATPSEKVSLAPYLLAGRTILTHKQTG